MLTSLIVNCFIFLLFGLVSGRKICYDDYGCFIDTVPFGGTLQRPLSLLPDTPQRISTKFTLFNRKNPTGISMVGSNVTSQFLAIFDSKIPTKFIIHGFLHHANKDWVLGMKNAILKSDNANVITVDWSKGNGYSFLNFINS